MGQAEFSDETGTVRLRGTLIGGGIANAIPQGGPLTQPLDCGSNQLNNVAGPSSGGDAATKTYVDNAVAVPLPQGRYSNQPLTQSIADGAITLMRFEQLDAGTALLDISNPQVPTFLTDGMYAITVNILCASPLSPGGYGTVDILLAGAAWVQGRCDYAGFVSLTARAAAGSSLGVNVGNNDGVNPRNFQLYACFVCRLGA